MKIKFHKQVDTVDLVKLDTVITSTSEEIKNEYELTPDEIAYCCAHANVIKIYQNYLEQNGKDFEVRNKFITLYNSNAFPELIKYTGPIGSWKTIERWKVEYKKSGNDIRVFAKPKKKRATSVTPEQAEILIKLALNPNRPLISEVVRMAMDYFTMKNMSPILSAITYRRYLEKWMKEHYADWVFYRDGEKALNDIVMPYIERDYDKIEVGDIIVTDGHILDFEIINPQTGKPKRMMLILYFDMKSSMPLGWDISPTENTFSIAIALRRSIIRLGKIPKIIYMDNGRAFNARYFTDSNIADILPLFDRLGIRVINAIPYHAQSKTIERFFKSFGELERLMPTYVGSSITTQPPRLRRGEKIHTRLYEKMMFGTSINIFQAHQLIAAWFDKYANRIQQDGHLKGKTPLEVFEAGRGPGVDKQQLTFLMMTEKLTTIYRNGIRLFNNYYWHEELFGKQWDEVIIRYDLLELDSVYVYDKYGKFVCEAKKLEKVHPAAEILGSEEDKMQLQLQLRNINSLKNSVIADAKQFLQEEIYPHVKKQYEVNMFQLNEKLEDEQIEINKAIKKQKRSIVDRWNNLDNEIKQRKSII